MTPEIAGLREIRLEEGLKASEREKLDLTNPFEMIENRDLTSVVSGHLDYKKKLPQLFELLRISCSCDTLSDWSDFNVNTVESSDQDLSLLSSMGWEEEYFNPDDYIVSDSSDSSFKSTN